MFNRLATLLGATCLSLSFGCGDDGGSGSTDSAGTDSAGTGGDTITMTGQIFAFAENEGVEGAQVCMYNHPEVPCVLSDANGDYVLPGVPKGIEAALEATATGFIPGLVWGVTPDEDSEQGVSLLSDTAQILFEQAINITFDMTKGHIAISAGDGMETIAGVTFTMSPDSGTQAYINDNNLPDDTVTETAANGVAGWGNVDLGEVEITATHASLNCVAGPNAIQGAAGAAKITVVAGYFNSMGSGFICS